MGCKSLRARMAGRFLFPMTVSLAYHRARPLVSKPAAEELHDTYPKGRRCPDPECITILCRWNPGPWCYLHAQKIESQLMAELAA